jgi:hypothetical protein
MREATSPDQLALPTSGMICYGQTICCLSRFVPRCFLFRGFTQTPSPAPAQELEPLARQDENLGAPNVNLERYTGTTLRV